MSLNPAFHFAAYLEPFPEGEDFLIKSDSGEAIEAPFSAIMSTDDRDGQGDEVDQDGLEVEQFVKSGKFNYEHGRGAAYVIGYPVSAEKVTLEGGRKATRVHGRLYLTKKLGLETYETMKAMSKSSGGRRMGLSVEGPVLQRDPVNRRRIVRSRVTNCAITDNPANTFARVDMVKSLTRQGYMLKAESGEFDEPKEDEDEDLPTPEDKEGDTPKAAEDPGQQAVEKEAEVELGSPEPVSDDAADDPGSAIVAALPEKPKLSVGDIALLVMQAMPDAEHREIISLAQAIAALANQTGL